MFLMLHSMILKQKAPVKLGYKFIEEDGKKVKVRVNRKTGAEVDKKKKKK